MKKLQTQFVRDISRYTENFCLGMSPRQTACAFLGAGVVAAAAFLLHLPAYAAVCLGFPIVLLGFWKPDGLPVEKYLFHWIESRLRRPVTRVFMSDDALYSFLWKGRVGGRRAFDPAQFEEEIEMNEEYEPLPETGAEAPLAQAAPDEQARRKLCEEPSAAPETAGEEKPEEKKAKTAKKPVRKQKTPAASVRLSDLPELVNDRGLRPGAFLEIPETPVLPRTKKPRKKEDPGPFLLPRDE